MVLDVGLSDAQRARLERNAKVVEIPVEPKTHPVLLKAFPRFFDPTGVVVIIDSDMIVTRSLGYVVDRAASGRICVFPDHYTASNRWFKEWETVFELKSPLRRQTYVNSGFIAVSTSHWPDFLSRFWELSERILPEAVFADVKQPFYAGDQDALNALLMSEIPPDAVEVLPAAHVVYPDELSNTKIGDAERLECTLHGERPAILHYSMAPKVWNRRAWLRVRRDAYSVLFGRVVCGTDVPLRMEPEELPLWLRPNVGGRIALATLDASHGTAAAIRRRLPPRASAALLRAKSRMIGLRSSLPPKLMIYGSWGRHQSSRVAVAELVSLLILAVVSRSFRSSISSSLVATLKSPRRSPAVTRDGSQICRVVRLCEYTGCASQSTAATRSRQAAFGKITGM